MIDVMDYGAVGDGVADDTAAIQAALNVFSRNELTGTWPTTGLLYFPKGEYRITSTLTYIGAPGSGLVIFGDIGGTRGPSGSVITWAGPDGGKMLHLRGANGLQMAYMEFDGKNKARFCVHAEAYWPGNALVSFTGSSGLSFDLCTFCGTKGAESAGLAFGSEGTPGAVTYQASEVSISRCQFTGNGQSPTAGFKTLQAGNTKNFNISHCNFSDCDIAVDWYYSSGVMQLDRPIFGNCRICIRKTTGSMTVTQAACECNVPGRFLDAMSGGMNPASTIVLGGYWHGTAPADDYVILCHGQLDLRGFDMRNNRTDTSLPKIKVNGKPPGMLISEGNIYYRAKGWAPVYDGSNNELFYDGPTYSYNQTVQLAIRSFGDYGGTGGDLVPLGNRCGMA